MKTTVPQEVGGFFPKPELDDVSGYGHRLAIGFVGLLLPFSLWLIAGLRPTEGLAQWKLLNSVSAYFYTGASPAFSGALIALAVFFFTYRGYENVNQFYDRLAAILAGIAAILVVFFPTSPPGALPAPSWWGPVMKTIHLTAAVILFGSFAYFSLFLFRKSKVEKADLPRDKRWRNGFYAFFGYAMIGSILWLIIAAATSRPIYWPETAALVFFALSWLLKGRLDRAAYVLSKHIQYYGRNPGHFFEDAKEGIDSSIGKRGVAAPGEDG